MNETFCLFLDGGYHPGVRMPGGTDRDSGHEIDEAITIYIPNFSA
jgi:hypothetical protein